MELSMKTWRCAWSVPCACLLSLLLLASADEAAPAGQSPLELRIPVAPAAVSTAGRTQLIYELHITRSAEPTLALLAVQVLDERGASLLDLHGRELMRRLDRSDRNKPASDDGRMLAAGIPAVLYVELSVEAGSVPVSLRHRLQYAIPGGDRDRGTWRAVVVEDAPTRVDQIPTPVLSAPLRGGPWVAIHDPTWARGHRRMLYAIDGVARIPGRYAMDFVKLDAQGHSTRDDVDVVANWLGYSEDVLAVADAVVVAARDDMTEVERVSAHPRHALGDATGNFIALDIGAGRFAFYEHLKPGSVRVSPGQRVRSGDVIAALGFTGDSTGPHLHFHVADRNAPLAAEGRPYAFAEFEWLGQFKSLEQLGSSAWQPRPASTTALRYAERPGSHWVLKFPQGTGR
jgi:murein DD-endopeptidase